jgi:hypothetical protein
VFWLRDLNVNTYFTIQVAAVDAGGNEGKKSRIVNVNTEMTGLYYTHATGAWQDLDSINWSTYEYWGYVTEFTLARKTQEDFFNFRFDGYLFIQQEGNYQFRITSNDGSRILLDKTLYVDHDGLHSTLTATGPVRTLNHGPLRITVDFFDYMGTDSLEVEYMGPDTNQEWKTVDAEALKSTGEFIPGELDLTIYPNPGSNGIMQLLIHGGTGDPFFLRVTDSMGKLVKEYIVLEADVTHFTLTDLDVQSGVYFVTVKQNEKSRSERLVVIR